MVRARDGDRLGPLRTPGRKATAVACAASLFAASLFAVASAQTGKRTVDPPAAQKYATPTDDALARAMDAVCAERELDPLASVPIDVMQSRASLPSRNSE
ncbi:MAG: hypothetical protein M3268_01605, partial [Acidobacteriota bacterium]|nr:hypothetical protein [Acidobacteriota bacterium]